MRFSVALPQSNRVATPTAIRDVAQAAEELGFWGLALHDHLIFDGHWAACGSDRNDGQQDLRTVYEPLTTYAHLAGLTERVRLLFSILLLPAREPILTAKQIATLDQLSGGRVSLGIGIGLAGNQSDPPSLSVLSGTARHEWRALGVPVRRRGRLTDERLAAMRSLWTEDTATFHGQFVDFENVGMFPKPVQPGGPPILIGGRSPAALERTARGGYTWLPNAAKPEEVSAGIDRLRQLHEHHGTRFTGEVVVNLFARLDESVAAAEDAFPKVIKDLHGDELCQRGLLGNPEEMIRRVGAYAAAGVTTLDLKPVYHSIDELISMMSRFAEQVMPACQVDAKPMASAMSDGFGRDT